MSDTDIDYPLQVIRYRGYLLHKQPGGGWAAEHERFGFERTYGAHPDPDQGTVIIWRGRLPLRRRIDATFRPPGEQPV